MQKILLTLALAAGISGMAQAQRSIRARSQGSSGTVSLGLKGGATLSDLVGANATQYEGVYGFHAGVFSNITLSRLIAFQPELLYAQKGAKSPTLLGDDVTRRLHYVDVPLSFHVNTNGFFLEAGPQLGFLVAAQDKYGTASSWSTAEFQVCHVGYLAGLGFQRKAGLGFGFRYNGAFTSLRQSDAIGNTTFQPEQRNSAFQLYLTYSFNEKF